MWPRLSNLELPPRDASTTWSISEVWLARKRSGSAPRKSCHRRERGSRKLRANAGSSWSKRYFSRQVFQEGRFRVLRGTIGLGQTPGQISTNTSTWGPETRVGSSANAEESDPDTSTPRRFGEIPGVSLGSAFADRRALANVGVYRPLQAGISGSQSEEGGSRRRKPYRYRWPDKIRDEVLARLLELNAERAQEEASSGATAGSGGLKLYVVERPVAAEELAEHIAAGTRSVSVFLVNQRAPDKESPDLAYAFQTEIEVRAEEPFVQRPDLRGALAKEPDEQVADLHYADTPAFATGHGVSVEWEVVDGSCCLLRTAWIPSAEVEKTKTVDVSGVELSMEALGALSGLAAGSNVGD